MPTIEEVLQQEGGAGGGPEPEFAEAVHTQSITTTSFLEFFKKPTGDGPVEDYIEHPLNFNHSKGTARIVRGFTGLLGSLNYWIIDVVFGLLEFRKPKTVDVTPPGSGPIE